MRYARTPFTRQAMQTRTFLWHNLALPRPTPAFQAETHPCAFYELGFGNRTPAMFPKANLPTGTLSSYPTGSTMKITNFCPNPLLPHNVEHQQASIIHDDNTVISPLAHN
jgi:hypothetical protein